MAAIIVAEENLKRATTKKDKMEWGKLSRSCRLELFLGKNKIEPIKIKKVLDRLY